MSLDELKAGLAAKGRPRRRGPVDVAIYAIGTLVVALLLLGAWII